MGNGRIKVPFQLEKLILESWDMLNRSVYGFFLCSKVDYANKEKWIRASTTTKRGSLAPFRTGPFGPACIESKILRLLRSTTLFSYNRLKRFCIERRHGLGLQGGTRTNWEWLKWTFGGGTITSSHESMNGGRREKSTNPWSGNLQRLKEKRVIPNFN